MREIIASLEVETCALALDASGQPGFGCPNMKECPNAVEFLFSYEFCAGPDTTLLCAGEVAQVGGQHRGQLIE